jgi:hypothetical protein
LAAAGRVPTPSAGAARVADAAAPKPPKDNPNPPAAAVVPNVKPFEVVVPVAAGAMVPKWKDGAQTEELAAAAAFAPPALPSTASRAPGFARKPLCTNAVAKNL